jgi:hypothetical protein
MLPDAELDQVASSIVKKLLFEVQNHNFCTAPQVLAVAALLPLGVQLVFAVLVHTAVVG